MNEKTTGKSTYPKTAGSPLYAPEDGICWFCKRNIYWRIPVEKAGTELVVGCPHCFRSYCD